VKGFTLFVLLSSLVISAPQAAPTLLVLCVLKTRSGRTGDEVMEIVSGFAESSWPGKSSATQRNLGDKPMNCSCQSLREQANP
jgi:hypothetical protein